MLPRKYKIQFAVKCSVILCFCCLVDEGKATEVNTNDPKTRTSLTGKALMGLSLPARNRSPPLPLAITFAANPL
jgi:hypothetical protein